MFLACAGCERTKIGVDIPAPNEYSVLPPDVQKRIADDHAAIQELTKQNAGFLKIEESQESINKTLNDRINIARDRLTAHQKSIDRLAERIAATESKVKGICTDLDGLEKELKSQCNRVEVLESKPPVKPPCKHGGSK